MTVPQAQDAHTAALDVLLAFIDTHEFVGPTDVDAARAALASLRSRLVVLEEERAAAQEALRRAYPYVMDALHHAEENTPATAYIVRDDLEAHIVPALDAAVSVADIPQEDTQ